jgi:hypothetical protein
VATPVQVVFDCADPATLGTFWAVALGYVEQSPPAGFATWEAFLDDIGVPSDERNSAYAIVDPDGSGPRIFFQRVPEGKTVKNRVHLDLNVGGGPGAPLEDRKTRIGAEAKRLVAAGASVVEPRSQRDEYWIVMQDPEGNEFCVQ